MGDSVRLSLVDFLWGYYKIRRIMLYISPAHVFFYAIGQSVDTAFSGANAGDKPICNKYFLKVFIHMGNLLLSKCNNSR